jgi:hypothetical protein
MYELFQAIDCSSRVHVSIRAKLATTCSCAYSVFKHQLRKEKKHTIKRKFFKNLNAHENVRFRKIVRYALYENSDLGNIGEMLIVCGFPSFIHGYELPAGEYRDCWKSGTRIRSYAHPMDKFTLFDHVLLQTYHKLRHARVNNLPIPEPKIILDEMQSKSEGELSSMGW